MYIVHLHVYRSQDEPHGIPAYLLAVDRRNVEHHAITGLTSAVAKMAKAIALQHAPTATASPSTGLSPNKIACLRSNYSQQLRDLHSLFETGALTEDEIFGQGLFHSCSFSVHVRNSGSFPK